MCGMAGPVASTNLNSLMEQCLTTPCRRQNSAHMGICAGSLGAAHQTGSGPWRILPHVAHQGGYAMRTYDLAPLYRSTVGFDRLFSLFDQVAGHDGGRHDGAPGYPPYNIERTGDNEYRITVAVAGFSEAEVSIEAKEDTLRIRGEKQAKT